MKYLLISNDTFRNKIHESYGRNGGIYKLHCHSDQKFDEIIPINRTLNVDKYGVLYLGKAKSFINRVITLKKSLLYKSGGHICGRRYWRDINENLRRQFPYDRLCVSFIESSNPEKLEKDELFNYCYKYGEPPPLNRFD